MKKFYVSAVAALAVLTGLTGYANGEMKTNFNPANVILPSSRHTGDRVWSADVWIVNTGTRYDGAQNFDNPDYNHIWGVPADDAQGNKWYENAYTLTSGPAENIENIDWEVKESPFTTDKWIAGDIMGDIYMRRSFTLDAVPDGPIFLACGRDDAPSEWYINGQLVHFENEGWDEGAIVLLNDDQKSALKAGENLMAVHVHQNWGGAYADCGLYEADGIQYLLSTVEYGGWLCNYKLLNNNDEIAGAVESGCFDLGTDLSDWQTGMGPFSIDGEKFLKTYWDSNNHPILVRRNFYLSESSLNALKERGELYLTCSYDEYPHVYLNGKEIWSANEWNDDRYDVYQLSEADKALLVAGNNVLGVSLQQGAGGGHIDYGFYVMLPCDGFTYEEAVDLTPYQKMLENLIKDAENLPQTPALAAAVVTAKEALATANSVEALTDAIQALEGVVTAVRDAQRDIKAYLATVELGYTDATAAEQFAAAVTRDDYAKAVRTLRYARRRAAADRHEDVFEGAEPAEGKFYLYNVGQKQFLQGGSDWGAHAALGMPGVELTFSIATDGNATNATPYLIQTGLHNGNAPHDYLSYGGYMDADYYAGCGGFVFLPVEGKTNVYYMVQGDYQDVHVQWDPYGRTDAGNNDETNVCTESRNLDLNNLDAQWKLVTRAERDALIATATNDNPVDVTYLIGSPNFSQRENPEQYWTMRNTSLYDRGGNHTDWPFESYNTDDMEINQMVEGLPSGKYELTVQGYYRNGSYDSQRYNDAESCAYAYADMDEVQLPNTLSENLQAPGEGTQSTTEAGEFDFPDSCWEAATFFRTGLYKVTLPFIKNTDESTPLAIGVYKDSKLSEPDWVVGDNFRLKYYGDADQDAVENVEVPETVTDGRVYNLQGMEVKNPSAPGIYIRNGSKFIIR